MAAATMYRDISTENGLIAFKLGTAKVKVGYTRMVHKVDLNGIRANLEHIERLASNLSATDHLMDTFDFKLKRAYSELKNLSPKRQRRGLINGLGKLVKFIAGNPDQDDLELINSNLAALGKTENHLVLNQNTQVKINLGIQNKVNKVSDTVRKIQTLMFNNINHVNDEFELTNLIFNIDILIKILEDLGEQVTFAKSNLLNLNILTDSEKQYVHKKLEDQHIHVHFENELVEFVNCIVTVKDNLAFIIVKIPIADTKEYELLQLAAINTNGSRIDTNVRYVTRNRDTIYEQTDFCVLCESSHQLQDNCIFNIMTNRKAKCSTVATQTRVSEIKPGVVLVDTNTAIEIRDSCSDNRMISTPTIVETGNCTVKILNFTFGNTAEEVDQPDYFIPLFGNKVEIDKHYPSIEEIHHLNLKNIDELTEVKLRLSHQTAIGTTATATLVVLLLILLYFHRRRNTIQGHEISELPQTTQEVNLQTFEENTETSSGSTTTDSKPLTSEVNRGRLTLKGGDVMREPPWFTTMN